MGFRSEFRKLRFSHKAAIALAPFFMLAMGTYMYNERANFNELKARGIPATGIIGEKKQKVKHGWKFNYYFWANGRQWEGFTYNMGGLEMGDTLIVTYLPDNPDVNRPALTFYPDSTVFFPKPRSTKNLQKLTKTP